jgi:hypothetical protein
MKHALPVTLVVCLCLTCTLVAATTSENETFDGNLSIDSNIILVKITNETAIEGSPVSNETSEIPVVLIPTSTTESNAGGYEVQCNVDGASVYFDGAYIGNIAGGMLTCSILQNETPYTSFTVSKAGYTTYEGLVSKDPEPGQTITINATLNPVQLGGVYPFLVLPNATIPVGTTKTVPIQVSQIFGATGVSFTLYFNGNELWIDSVRPYDLFYGSSVYSNVNNSAGFASIILTNQNGISTVYPATIITVNVTSRGQNNTIASLTADEAYWSDKQFNRQNLSVQDGWITKRNEITGDFNGNGVVDIGDVSFVAYMIIHLVPQDIRADYNGNGVVDIGDAARISYYFIGKIPSLVDPISPEPTPSPGATYVITFTQDLTIVPDITAYVKVGTKVTWWDNDPYKDHTLQAIGNLSQTYFGTGMVSIPHDGNFSITFDKAGSYDYESVYQPVIVGKIVVS